MDMIEYSMQLALVLKTAIEKSGKTMAEVARDSGIAWTTFYRKVNHPNTSSFTVMEIVAIAKAINVDYMELLKTTNQSFQATA